MRVFKRPASRAERVLLVIFGVMSAAIIWIIVAKFTGK